jgi:hypothetical protein
LAYLSTLKKASSSDHKSPRFHNKITSNLPRPDTPNSRTPSKTPTKAPLLVSPPRPKKIAFREKNF